jgi:hypothetical protein
MTIQNGEIILKKFILPFVLCFSEAHIPNSYEISIFFNEIQYDAARSTFHRFFPKFMRKYSPPRYFTGRGISHMFFRHPIRAKGMHFEFGEEKYGFGTMMSRESYDEILALILAQRAKWEKEHPEDAIASEPEETETHSVDSSSQ